jgi:subtilase family serine protease
MQKGRDGYLAIIVVLVIASFALFSQYYTTGAVGSTLTVLPELEIVDVEVTSEYITTTIQNIGQGTKHRFAVNFYEREIGSIDDGNLVARQFFKDGLNDKDPETFTVGWTSTIVRNNEVVVRLDPEDYIREANEANNLRTAPFVSGTITPDLYISYLDVIDDKVLFEVSNAGSDFEDEFVINTYLIRNGEKLISDLTISSFGESEVFNVPFVAPDKPYTIRVIVDDDSQVAETNNNNNIFEIVVS